MKTELLAVLALMAAPAAFAGEGCPFSNQAVTAQCPSSAVHAVSTVASSDMMAAAEKPKDIVDTAVGTEGFKTLVAAVKAAGLVDALKGEGPFTVFAPTDKAFEALPKGTLETLLKPENKKKLAGILTYHVVPGKVLAADVVKMNGAKVDTLLEDKPVTIKVEEGKVYVDNAEVVATDVMCSNGVIHVIDAVILPKSE
ncbi:Immunogenic protein MPT70 precursor [Pirellulimonas nuda]|uniref:Immunogenic protein MPT70 n=2 Tax=Pirellulimonas nuda TaxID=2528009 RepID=A0A518DH24_9BACT|nr:fasciclin domain-containing protein [Pirellulimonas nuda]QDU90781.1 Immunogenic protein MPT70 precursor [Pirellulimonas nuda]